MKCIHALVSIAAVAACAAAVNATSHGNPDPSFSAETCQPHWVSTFDPANNFFRINSMVVFDDGLGGGPALYVQAYVTGEVNLSKFAKLDSNGQWTDLSILDSFSSFEDMIVFDDGIHGPTIFACGSFITIDDISMRRIARWNPVTQLWTVVGGGFDKHALTLAVFDDGSGTGPALFAAGIMDLAGPLGDGSPVGHIAKLDPIADQWLPLGDGAPVLGIYWAMEVFDDGNGPALYAAGGSGTLNNIGKWDGTQWSALGTGMNNPIYTLQVFDDGDGDDLYAGGPFTQAGGMAIANLAKWDGSQWSDAGADFNADPRVQTVFDDGTGDGPALYIGGFFTEAAGQPARRIVKYDGKHFSPLGDGLGEPDGATTPLAMAGFDDGSGNALFVGGMFSTSPAGDPAFAKWQSCDGPYTLGDLNKDGTVDVSDLLILLAQWGQCPLKDTCPADLNEDDAVDVSDLLILLGNWG